jgi:antitoxin component YwqK of YwqJK toxin-antitoxin module
VYKWKKDKKKVSERIRLGCGFDEDIIYHGHSGGGLFVNGLRHGKWILRSCDSGVKQEINYNKGLVTGHYKVYVTLITIKSEYAGEIINTFRDREKVHYRDTILYETNFGDGDGNGEWKSFWGYTKGFAIRETGYYKNGKKSGEWCYYTAKGNFLYRKEYYENGVLIRYEYFEIPDEYRRFVD